MSAAIVAKGTVLFVEDERDTRELLAAAIVRAGYRCIAAKNVREAVEATVEAGVIDVVVTDLVLGADDRGGLHLMTELKTAGVLAPVVIITAFADLEKVKTALNQGAAHLLEKPFRAPELVEVIDRIKAQPAGARRDMAQILERARLTDKETVVARRLLEGLSYNEIAELEGNSSTTIRQHVSSIYAKCGVSSRAELFRLVYEWAG
jgi:DNA-binding NarL/FixJ family response regulator